GSSRADHVREQDAGAAVAMRPTGATASEVAAGTVMRRPRPSCIRPAGGVAATLNARSARTAMRGEPSASQEVPPQERHPPTGPPELLLEDELTGVLRHAVEADLVVEVRAGGAPGVADRADVGAAGHLLARLDQDAREVREAGLQPVAVVEHDH